MKKNVVIIDYGLGNLFSIFQACEYVGLSPIISSNEVVIRNADALILPGVGAFGGAMQSLNDSNLIAPLLEFAQSGKPFLGICLGMQLLFTKSYEFGTHSGLNLIKGEIMKFPKCDQTGNINIIPQIQWNQIYNCKNGNWEKSALKNTKDGEFMYFVHSYYAVPENESNSLSKTIYSGIEYCSSVIHDNITGIQFHPEKSGKLGLLIYKNWSETI